jgi:hypothetical protein
MPGQERVQGPVWPPRVRPFKVVYGGLRRREAAVLDVAGFAPDLAAPELGGSKGSSASCPDAGFARWYWSKPR